MRCIGCGSEAVSERRERTAHGYRRFRCRTCGKQSNERSGTLLNHVQYPSDVVALVVLWRLRYKLSLRDLPEMFAVRGKAGRSWYVDETYIKVAGRWCYVYRTVDGSGALVDVLFSDKRDMAAAKAFFRSAKATTGVTPGATHETAPVGQPGRKSALWLLEDLAADLGSCIFG